MIVALPLSLGFGIASGMGAQAGLYGAISVGLLTAVFGGTRGQISAPTAPMAVAMAVVVATHAETMAEAFMVIVLAGLIQVVLGLSGLGRFVAYTPHVVVSGFMSGIGVIVILMQILLFLGRDSMVGVVHEVMRELPEALDHSNPSALWVGVITLATALAWPRKLSRFAPAPLVALAVGTVACLLVLPEAPRIGEVPGGLPEPKWETIPSGFLLSALEPAMILALLGSIDSLLTSLVADSMLGHRHNPDRELVGQGIGNVAAGLIGAMPGSGSPPLTVTNIRSGGNSRLSGIIYAVLLLLVVLGLGRHVSHIPLAALAGVLMKAGWDVIDFRLLSRIHRIRRGHLAVLITTLVLTVSVDLIVAVAIGLIVSGMVHARQLERLELDSIGSVAILDRTFFAGETRMKIEDPYSARVGMVVLNGNFTVASASKLIHCIGREIQDHDVVLLDFSPTLFIDDSASMVIKQLIEVAECSRTACIVVGLSGEVAQTLNALDVLRDVPGEHIVDSIDEARRRAGDHLLALDEAQAHQTKP